MDVIGVVEEDKKRRQWKKPFVTFYFHYAFVSFGKVHE